MNVEQLLARRQRQWEELDALCTRFERPGARRPGGVEAARFASLYRAACADLALADAYQLPSHTVDSLHRLVGRAHNQFYRGRRLDVRAWSRELLHEVPRRLYRDGALRVAAYVFWGVFALSMLTAMSSRRFALELLTEAGATRLEDSFSQPIAGREFEANALMASFYIQHNTSIGLRCFAAGLLFGIGGLFATTYNAAHLGASFGYMAASPYANNFFHFVTAHGPFELTAIVLSAAAGMRLGFAMVQTGGYSRLASLRIAAREAMPSMGAAMVLFFLAALIEGYLSPSAADYSVKAFVAVLSSGLLTVYFLVLGRRPAGSDAA